MQWGESERRANGGLTDEQVETIKEAILASIYEDIGRSIIKKVLWVLGAASAALLAWVSAHTYFKI